MLADYDCEISYHSSKENVVVDGLSFKESRVSYHLKFIELVVIPSIFEQLWAARIEGLKENHVNKEVKVKKWARLVKDKRGFLTFQGRLWVLKVGGVRDTLLQDTHRSKYLIHPDAKKM